MPLDLKESPLTRSRYAGLPVVLAETRRQLQTPEILTVDASRLERYTLTSADRLDTLAFNLLGDSRLWWVLVDLNREILADTLMLPSGVEILVPTLEAVSAL